MMNTKELIIHLIREDMRYRQYMAALRKLGIEVYGFDPDLMSVVGKILEIRDEMYDSWLELYITESARCENFSIQPLGRNLYPLAEECYKALVDFTSTM